MTTGTAKPKVPSIEVEMTLRAAHRDRSPETPRNAADGSYLGHTVL